MSSNVVSITVGILLFLNLAYGAYNYLKIKTILRNRFPETYQELQLKGIVTTSSNASMKLRHLIYNPSAELQKDSIMRVFTVCKRQEQIQMGIIGVYILYTVIVTALR